MFTDKGFSHALARIVLEKDPTNETALKMLQQPKNRAVVDGVTYDLDKVSEEEVTYIWVKGVASHFSPITSDQAGQQEQADKENEVKGNVRKGVYCRNCTDLILFSEMRPFRKDNDVVDMLCPGCGATLVEGE